MNMTACRRAGPALAANGVELPLSEAQRARSAGSEELVYGLRPEHLRIDTDGLPARLQMLEPTGPETYARFDTALGTLTARVPGKVSERVGDAVRLAWRPDDAHLFDARSERRVA